VRAPSLSAISEAIRRPGSLVDQQLAAASLVRTPTGRPFSACGNFAVTYRIRVGAAERAIRIFYRSMPDSQERYSHITPTLQTLRLPGLVWCRYLHEGIWVDGQTYPAVLMPWVVGDDLNQSLARDRSRGRVRRIRTAFEELYWNLSAARISHGDLQHGNLIVGPDGSVTAIDYDGMFVDGMLELSARTLGHPNYQHPQRSPLIGPKLDRFSFILIDLALRVLEFRPELWTKYNDEENILFCANDLRSPRHSPLFDELCQDNRLVHMARRFMAICEGPADETPSLQTFFGLASRPLEHRDDAFRAADRSALLSRIGHPVRVIGRPHKLYIGHGRDGRRFAFLNFGHRRDGCLTGKVWSRGKDLAIPEAVLEGVIGEWVLLAGEVSQWICPRYKTAPEILLTGPGSLIPLSAREAAQYVPTSSL
jgi:hypothetical protein